MISSNFPTLVSHVEVFVHIKNIERVGACKQSQFCSYCVYVGQQMANMPTYGGVKMNLYYNEVLFSSRKSIQVTKKFTTRMLYNMVWSL